MVWYIRASTDMPLGHGCYCTLRRAERQHVCAPGKKKETFHLHLLWSVFIRQEKPRCHEERLMCVSLTKWTKSSEIKHIVRVPYLAIACAEKAMQTTRRVAGDRKSVV